MGNETRSHKGRIIPISAMGSSWALPITTRILLTMMTLADRDGICWVGVWTLTKLIGEGNDGMTEGEKRKTLTRVRQARHALGKKGQIAHVTRRADWGVQHGYQVATYPIHPSTLDTWNQLGSRSGTTYEADVVPSHVEIGELRKKRKSSPSIQQGPVEPEIPEAKEEEEGDEGDDGDDGIQGDALEDLLSML